MPITQQALANTAALKIYPERLAYLDRYLDAYIREGRRQAAVVKVQRYGVPIFEGCYGENTKDYGMSMDLIFPVASITKSIVAALLMILQEDGVVHVDEPAWRILPEFDGGGREKICLWHLLTHTSGLKDDDIWPATNRYVEEEYGLKAPGDEGTDEQWTAYHASVREKMGLKPEEEDRGRLNDPHYLISLKLPIEHKPRSHMTYCNYGYQTLKYAIDQATGEPIDAFAQRVLFHPLGMNDTYWRLPEEKWPRVLGRKENGYGASWVNSADCMTNESGSGGLKTTVPDATRFMQMMLNGGTLDGARVLTKTSVARMIVNYNADVPGGEGPDWNCWGLGFNVRGGKMDDAGILRSARAFDHGGWGGVKMMADPDYGITAVHFTAKYDLPDKEQIELNHRFYNVLYSALEP